MLFSAVSVTRRDGEESVALRKEKRKKHFIYDLVYPAARLYTVIINASRQSSV